MFVRSRGVTLVELIVFMVIVGVALAGVFAAFNTMTRASADPQVRKQVLAIAESLMEEVALMPFTYCDPDDANAADPTLTSSAGCASASLREDVTLGPETGETRYNAAAPFDNVSDYHGFAMISGIQDITDAPIPGLGAYSASISVTRAGTAMGLPTDDDALRISVTVTGPGNTSVTLDGYRTRYAPTTGL